MALQYLRKVGLTVLSPGQGPTQTPGPATPGQFALGGSGLDLSNMRIRFSTHQFDYETPNHATIRVYNLSDETARAVQKEYSNVILQAGYEGGSYGVIFQGQIKMVRRGREDQVNTYLDILGADGDFPYNFDTVKMTVATGATQSDVVQTLAKEMGLQVGYATDLPPGALSRGKVLYGLSRDHMRRMAQTSGAVWSIQDGQLVVFPLTGYRPGEAVVVNSQTGMIGLPEQTEGGIRVKILINPRVRVGGLLQIDNRSVQRAFIGGTNLFAPGRLDQSGGIADKLLPRVTDDGFYRVMVAEYEGDSRGGESSPWYANLTCLAVDRSASPQSSVAPTGGAVAPPGQ